MSKTTDFYLAHLAQAHGMKFATLNENIAHAAVFVIPNPPVPPASAGPPPSASP